MANTATLSPTRESLARRLRRFAVSDSFAAWRAGAALCLVVGLSFALYAWRLDEDGYGNTYYAAAVRSMTVSWSNFFFAASDPGGFITVDKPPVFLWVGALSATVFGYSSWSILLPSAVAGAAATGLLWIIVRRHFGVLAATFAGLTLALTPIAVAVNRLNLPEPIMTLALVGAAGATLRSVESRRWWAWTIAAGALVGIAFNTKMLAAWIPGPAFALAIVAGTAAWRPWRPALVRVAAQLALLAAATFAVSASWMLIVDAWPEDSRPYVGGSDDNTVYNLVVDYNGVGRVEGNAPPGGGRPQVQPPAGNTPPGGNVTPPNGAQTRPQNGPGGIIAGVPGLWRMFDDANAPQIAWMLPFALGGGTLALVLWRRNPARRAAVVIWLGWVLLFGLVFSYAQGIYHSYYTSAMAPGIAALSGITLAALVRLATRNWRWLAVAAALATVTLLVQLDVNGRFPGHVEGLWPYAFALLAIGAVVTGLGAWLHRRPRLSATAVSIGITAALSGLLVVPAGWSVYEATHPSMNASLPQAGARQGAASRTFGSPAFDQGAAALAAWLKSTPGSGLRWDLVVNSAQNASTLIAAHDLSVMPLGGFSGSDPTVTVDEFADMVESGDVRHVLVGGNGPPGAVPGNNVGPGLPPGTAPQPGGNIPPGVQPGNNPRPGGNVQPGNNVVPGRNANPGAGPNVQPQLPGNAQPGGFRIAPGRSSGDPTRGAAVVMTAVQAACAPVTSPDLPAQYAGALYDCSGAAEELRQLG